MRKWTHAELVLRQQYNAHGPRLPLVVILDDIRSLYNVGSIFRTCDGIGVEKLWLCGTTGYPPNGQLAKTALGAEQSVSWEYCQDVLDCVRGLKSRAYTIVFLEQTTTSIPYEEFRPSGPVGLVVGNEINGIRQEVLPLGDVAIDIAMAGVKNSLNTAVALGIAAYHIRSCLKVLEVRTASLLRI